MSKGYRKLAVCIRFGRTVTVLLLMIILLPSLAFSMLCLPKELDENISNADVIFLGTVKSRTGFNMENDTDSVCWKYSNENPGCGYKIASFDIKTVWMGNLPRMVTVLANDGCYCLGSYFSLERTYIVFANQNNEDLPKGLVAEYKMQTACDGTTEVFDEGDKTLIHLLDEKLKNNPAERGGRSAIAPAIE